jgi:hypothetical protein
MLTGITFALIPIFLQDENLGQIISGYNSLPIEQKLKYDKIVLYRRFRILCIIIGIEITFFTILITTLLINFLLVSVLSSCFIIIVTVFIGYSYMNRSKK